MNDANDLLRVPIIIVPIYNSIDFGLENVCLVRADVTAAQHTLLTSYSDVIAFPSNLNNSITQTAIDNVTPKLEAYKIPADWLSTSLTYKQALRRVYRIFQVHKFMHQHGTNFNLFSSGYTFSTTFSELPVKARDKLVLIATNLNADTSQLAASSTLRQIFKVLMDAQSGDWDGRLNGTS